MIKMIPLVILISISSIGCLFVGRSFYVDVYDEQSFKNVDCDGYIAFASFQIISERSHQKFVPSNKQLNLFLSIISSENRKKIQYTKIGQVPPVSSSIMLTYYTNLIAAPNIFPIVFDDPDSRKTMGEYSHKLLLSVHKCDYFMTSTVKIEKLITDDNTKDIRGRGTIISSTQNYENPLVVNEMAISLTITIYDRNGDKIYSNKYLKSYSDGKKFKSYDMAYECYFDKFVQDYGIEINKGITTILSNAKVSKEKNLNDLYNELSLDTK